MDSDYQREFGNLEGKIENFREEVLGRFNRLEDVLFKNGGLEPRLRAVEREAAVSKAKTALIAVLTAGIAGAAVTLVAAWISR